MAIGDKAPSTTFGRPIAASAAKPKEKAADHDLHGRCVAGGDAEEGIEPAAGLTRRSASSS